MTDFYFFLYLRTTDELIIEIINGKLSGQVWLCLNKKYYIKPENIHLSKSSWVHGPKSKYLLIFQVSDCSYLTFLMCWDGSESKMSKTSIRTGCWLHTVPFSSVPDEKQLSLLAAEIVVKSFWFLPLLSCFSFVSPLQRMINGRLTQVKRRMGEWEARLLVFTNMCAFL